MKKITSFISVILLGMVSLLFFFHTACTIQSTPVTVAFVRTPTPTITPTPGPVCPAVNLPSPGSSYVFYSNGTANPAPPTLAFDTFSGGGSANPAIGSSTVYPLGSNTTNIGVTFNYQGGYTGLSLAPASGTIDMSAYTTCTFWAKASQPSSVGFDGAQLSSNCANTGVLDVVSLTTCWQEFTIQLVPGSRTDGEGAGCGTSTMTACIDWFVCSLGSSPGAGITLLDVYFDQVQFQ